MFTQASKEVLVERRRERKACVNFEGGSRPRGSVCNLPLQVDVVVVNEHVFHGFRGLGEGVYSRWERFKHNFGVQDGASGGFCNLEHKNSTNITNDLLADMDAAGACMIDLVYEHREALKGWRNLKSKFHAFFGREGVCEAKNRRWRP